MNLSSEQLLDVMLSLMHGMSAAAWEGVTDRPWWELSDQEKTAALGAVRSAHETLIRNMNPEPGAMDLNQQFLDRMNLASVKKEEEQQYEQRQQMLAASASRRGSTSGLKQAINDLLSHSSFWDRSQRLAVERRLAARKLPKLALLEAMLRKKHEKILKRGKIRNDEEYYLAMEILNFMDFPIESDDRQQLSILVGTFESRNKPV